MVKAFSTVIEINQFKPIRWSLDMAGESPGEWKKSYDLLKTKLPKVANWTNWQEGEPNNLGGQVSTSSVLYRGGVVITSQSC